METALFARRYYPQAQAFVERKTVEGHQVLG
jgi:hypothetical protein